MQSKNEPQNQQQAQAQQSAQQQARQQQAYTLSGLLLSLLQRLLLWVRPSQEQQLLQQATQHFQQQQGQQPQMQEQPIQQWQARDQRQTQQQVQQYSTWFETQLKVEDYGKSREEHNAICNQLLLEELKGLKEERWEVYGGMPIDKLIENISSKSKEPPESFVWEHCPTSTAEGREGVMRLVPEKQHTGRSEFWKIIHPEKQGGYHEWAIPHGAPAPKPSGYPNINLKDIPKIKALEELSNFFLVAAGTNNLEKFNALVKRARELSISEENLQSILTKTYHLVGKGETTLLHIVVGHGYMDFVNTLMNYFTITPDLLKSLLCTADDNNRPVVWRKLATDLQDLNKDGQPLPDSISSRLPIGYGSAPTSTAPVASPGRRTPISTTPVPGAAPQQQQAQHQQGQQPQMQEQPIQQWQAQDQRQTQQQGQQRFQKQLKYPQAQQLKQAHQEAWQRAHQQLEQARQQAEERFQEQLQQHPQAQQLKQAHQEAWQRAHQRLEQARQQAEERAQQQAVRLRDQQRAREQEAQRRAQQQAEEGNQRRQQLKLRAQQLAQLHPGQYVQVMATVTWDGNKEIVRYSS